MMKILAALALTAAVLSLSACGKNTKPSREWIEISCSGFADWTACYAKAEQFCPGGYDLGKKEENVITQGRVMTFACKN